MIILLGRMLCSCILLALRWAKILFELIYLKIKVRKLFYILSTEMLQGNSKFVYLQVMHAIAKSWKVTTFAASEILIIKNISFA